MNSAGPGTQIDRGFEPRTSDWPAFLLYAENVHYTVLSTNKSTLLQHKFDPDILVQFVYNTLNYYSLNQLYIESV